MFSATERGKRERRRTIRYANSHIMYWVSLQYFCAAREQGLWQDDLQYDSINKRKSQKETHKNIVCYRLGISERHLRCEDDEAISQTALEEDLVSLSHSALVDILNCSAVLMVSLTAE